MAVKLYRCSNLWVKFEGHPCWRVQHALDDMGIEYDVVKGPLMRGRRDEVERLSGQRAYPVIQFEDGTVYRDESKAMAARIRAGNLFEGRAPAEPMAAPSESAQAPPFEAPPEAAETASAPEPSTFTEEAPEPAERPSEREQGY